MAARRTQFALMLRDVLRRIDTIEALAWERLRERRN
jgi:hypothetical protein